MYMYFWIVITAHTLFYVIHLLWQQILDAYILEL
jgi:hypothetical protein